MRLLTLFLISSFVLSIADIPFEALQRGQVKSCCCKSFSTCRCSHGKGICPMKKKQEAEKKSNSHCALKEKKSPKSEMQVPENPAMLLLKALGCGSTEEHKAAPSYSRDFTFYFETQPLSHLPLQFYSLKDFQPDLPQIFYSFEKPPQNLLFSL